MIKSSALAFVIIVFLGACVSLSSKTSDESAWKSFYAEIQRSEKQSRNIASSRAGVEILRKILEEVPLRDLFIACDQQACFQNKMVIAFDQAFRSLKNQKIQISLTEYESEQKRFLNHNSYSKVAAWVDTFHQMFLSGIELRASERAVDLAQGCESELTSKSEVIIEEFAPFTGGGTYLPKAYYACINSHWQDELDQVLDETLDRLSLMIKTKEARLWIVKKQITPIYQKTLNQMFAQRKKAELDRWNQSIKEDRQKFDVKNIESLREEFHFLNVESMLFTQDVS